VEDIDSQRMLIHVRERKGRIPRDIGLSPVFLERLRICWRPEKPKDWLFPSSEHSERALDDRTIRLICRQAARRAELKKKVSPHVFRCHRKGVLSISLTPSILAAAKRLPQCSSTYSTSRPCASISALAEATHLEFESAS